MRWVVRIVVMYAAVLVVMGVVAMTASYGRGAIQPAHSQANAVSHRDYELHKSIGHVP